MNGAANMDGSGWLSKIYARLNDFLLAVAEARIPPSKMALVPEQGSTNLLTGGIAIILYTAAGHVTASGRNLSLASEFALVVIGAVLLFVSAITLLFISRKTENLIDDWNRTASAFIVVWLFSLVAYLFLTYPLMMVTNEFILLDQIAYSFEDTIFSEAIHWRADLIKSLICAFLAGSFLIYRTKRADPSFRLTAVEPWMWLLLMTIVVGFVFYLSLYKLSSV